MISISCSKLEAVRINPVAYGQEKLLQQFVRYFDQVKKQKLEWVDGQHKIKWQLLPDAKLTGITPWVLKNDKAYYSFLFTETDFPWQQQLRFPLFQQYLIDNNIDTTMDKMQVGIYSLSENKFNTKSFTSLELTAAVDETNNVFQLVYSEYLKKKK